MRASKLGYTWLSLKLCDAHITDFVESDGILREPDARISFITATIYITDILLTRIESLSPVAWVSGYGYSITIKNLSFIGNFGKWPCFAMINEDTTVTIDGYILED
jgi:hypothetical protein